MRGILFVVLSARGVLQRSAIQSTFCCSVVHDPQRNDSQLSVSTAATTFSPPPPMQRLCDQIGLLRVLQEAQLSRRGRSTLRNV